MTVPDVFNRTAEAYGSATRWSQISGRQRASVRAMAEAAAAGGRAPYVALVGLRATFAGRARSTHPVARRETDRQFLSLARALIACAEQRRTVADVQPIRPPR